MAAINVKAYHGPIDLSDATKNKLAEIRAKAAYNVVDAKKLPVVMQSAQASLEHRHLMQAQSFIIPPGFTLVYSVEVHMSEMKRFRHLTLGSPNPELPPNAKTAWQVAELMGFQGKITDCAIVWLERLSQGVTIQMMQALIGSHTIDEKPIIRDKRDMRMCVQCGALNTAETGVSEKGAKPSEGDIAICFSCGLVTRLQAGVWERQSAEQIAALDPEMRLEIEELTQSRIQMFGTIPLNQQNPPKEGNA